MADRPGPSASEMNSSRAAELSAIQYNQNMPANSAHHGGGDEKNAPIQALDKMLEGSSMLHGLSLNNATGGLQIPQGALGGLAAPPKVFGGKAFGLSSSSTLGEQKTAGDFSGGMHRHEGGGGRGH